jgi:hypothetical protein
MITLTTENDKHDSGRTVEPVEPVDTSSEGLSRAAAAVRVSIERRGDIALIRMDVAVACSFINQRTDETVVAGRATFFATVPA